MRPRRSSLALIVACAGVPRPAAGQTSGSITEGGAAFLLVGVSTAGLLAPALYWAPRAATESERARAAAARGVTAPAKI